MTLKSKLRKLKEEKLRRLKAKQKPLLISLKEWCELTLGYPLHPWQVILCERLEALRHGGRHRILMHGPMRFGKSIIVGQRLIPWLIMHNPEWRCPLLTCGVQHSSEFGEVIRDLMRSDLYKKIAPQEAWLEREDCAVDKFRTIARARKNDGDYSFRALGFKTGFVGKGADCLVVDDPYESPEHARSEATNGKTIRTYRESVKRRVGADKPLIVMYHRYHEADLGGYILEEGGWQHLRFPAIADSSDNKDGSDPTNRKDGEPLSDLWPLSHLEEIKEEDPETFASMYQGRPKPATGGFIRRTDFKIINSWDVPVLDQRWRGYDLATSVKQTGHCSATVMGGVNDNLDIYIFDIQWWKKEFPDARSEIIEIAKRDGSRIPIGVENKQAGMAMVQDLTRVHELIAHDIQAIDIVGDKKERAGGWVSRGRAGHIYLVRPNNVIPGAKPGEPGFDWIPAFLNICARFDGLGLTLDDPVDAFSIFWQMVQAMRGGHTKTDDETRPQPGTQAFYDYLEQQALARAGGDYDGPRYPGDDGDEDE